MAASKRGSGFDKAAQGCWEGVLRGEQPGGAGGDIVTKDFWFSSVVPFFNLHMTFGHMFFGTRITHKPLPALLQNTQRLCFFALVSYLLWFPSRFPLSLYLPFVFQMLLPLFSSLD